MFGRGAMRLISACGACLAALQPNRDVMDAVISETTLYFSFGRTLFLTGRDE